MSQSQEILHSSSSEIVSGIEQVLQELQPFIQGHGGMITFVRYQDARVYVKLTGACSHCPISSYTLQFGILEALQKKYPEIIDVVAIDI